MKIKNSTNYKTKELRKIFKFCLKRTGMTGRRLTVDVLPRGRNTARNGYAYYGRGDFSKTFITIFLNDRITATSELIRTFIHELAHTRGIKHKEMSVSEPEESEWNEILPLGIFPREAEEKPIIPLIEKRHQKALKMQNKYEKAIKVNKKLLTKWQKKVRYYEAKENK